MAASLRFTPFPALRTQRLMLRALTLVDSEIIFSFHSDMENRQYIDKAPPDSLEETQGFIRKIQTGIADDKWIMWAICSTTDQQLMGTICLWNFSENQSVAELGYELGANFQGKGFMREALAAVVEFSFTQLQLSSLEAYTHVENQASQKLLVQAQFNQQRVIEEAYHFKDGAYSMAVYIKERGEVK